MHRGDFRHSSELSTSGIVRVDTPPPSAIFSNVTGFQPSLERRDAPQDDRTDLALLTTKLLVKNPRLRPRHSGEGQNPDRRPKPNVIFSNVSGFQPSLERRDAPQDDRTDLALLTTNCGLKTRAYAPVILAKARFQIGGQSQTSSLATFLDSSLRWKDRMRRRMTERT